MPIHKKINQHPNLHSPLIHIRQHQHQLHHQHHLHHPQHPNQISNPQR